VMEVLQPFEKEQGTKKKGSWTHRSTKFSYREMAEKEKTGADW